MLLFIYAAVALHLLGALILIIVWWRAPEGYEDATQFHYVTPPEERHAGRDAEYMVPNAWRGTR
jgi:hypothetical protein